MSMTRISPYLAAIGMAIVLSVGFGYAQSTQHDHATPPAAQGISADRQAMMASMQAEQNVITDNRQTMRLSFMARAVYVTGVRRRAGNVC